MILARCAHFARSSSKLRPSSSSSLFQSKQICTGWGYQPSIYKKNSDSHFSILDRTRMRDLNIYPDDSYSRTEHPCVTGHPDQRLFTLLPVNVSLPSHVSQIIPASPSSLPLPAPPGLSLIVAYLLAANELLLDCQPAAVPSNLPSPLLSD